MLSGAEKRRFFDGRALLRGVLFLFRYSAADISFRHFFHGLPFFME